MKNKLLLLLLLTCFSHLAMADSTTSEPLPDLDNNPANTSILNDQLRQTQRKLLALEGGIDINANTSGILTTSRGGTGQDFSAVAQDSIPYFSAIGVMGNIGIGTAGYVLTAGSPPSWQSPSKVVFSGHGTYTWIAPAGVYGIWVTLQGAGAAGAHDSAQACSGAGAGAFIGSAFYPVVPATSYTVVIGQGGIGTSGAGGGGCAAGPAGGSSSFDSNLIANGGTGSITGGAVQSASNMNAPSTTGGSRGFTFGVQLAGGNGHANSGATGGGGGASIFGAGGNGDGGSPSSTSYGAAGAGASAAGTSGSGIDGIGFLQF